MSNNPEADFKAQYENEYTVQKAAQELYRAQHPTGMHTNGPCRVVIDASHLLRILSRWKKA
jgi:hypothetical protein